MEELAIYGKKVIGYKSKGEGLKNLIWRILYQDANNTYLISETENKDYPIKDLVFYDWIDDAYVKGKNIQKYNTGADVSIEGRELMPMARELFVAENNDFFIPITAYLCDTEVWDNYRDSEGNAEWAMGTPTIELLVNSFNEMLPENKILLYIEEGGYGSEPYGPGVITTEMLNGLYLLNNEDDMVVASPNERGGQCILERRGYFGDGTTANGCSARPIVCIPNEKFNNANYTLE